MRRAAQYDSGDATNSLVLEVRSSKNFPRIPDSDGDRARCSAVFAVDGECSHREARQSKPVLHLLASSANSSVVRWNP